MDINYWAVLVCGVLAMVVGFIWYGPLFGKKWMELMRADAMSSEAREKMKKMMMPMYGMQFLLTLFQVYAIAYLMDSWMNVNGIKFSLFVYVGFILPLIAGNALWNGDSSRNAWSRFFIQAGYQLVMFFLYGYILGMWPAAAI